MLTKPVWGETPQVVANAKLDEMVEYSQSIHGAPIAEDAPANGDTLVYNSTTLEWEPAPPGGVGSGDMTKAVYDPNDDGKVNSAAAADNVPWSGVTGVPSSFTPSAHATSHRPGGSDAIPTAAAAGLANVNAEGSSTSLARADHTHKRDVRVQSGGADVGTRNKINFTGAGVSVTDSSGTDSVIVDIPGGGAGSDSKVDAYTEGTQVGTESRAMNFDGSFVITEDAVNDRFDVELVSELDANARLAVRVNSDASDTGLRRRLNFVEGTGISIVAVDDSGDEEIDITIAATGGGGGGAGHVIQEEGVGQTARVNLNFTGGGVSVVDDAGNDATEIVIPGLAAGMGEAGVLALAIASAQEIPNNTATAVAWTTETSDPAGYFDSGSNTLFTVPSGYGGRHLFTGGVEFESNATGYRAVSLLVNDTDTHGLFRFGASSSNDTNVPINAQVDLVAGDEVKVIVQHTAGAALDIQPSVYLNVTRLAAVDEVNAVQIQGVPVSSTAPASGEALVYDGTEYVPGTVSGGGGGSADERDMWLFA